jgi:hypothetical protein
MTTAITAVRRQLSTVLKKNDTKGSEPLRRPV